MTLEIQQATPNHAPQIAHVKHRVWEDEDVDETHVARVIAEPDHVTHIALEDNQVVGFVDSFLTLSSGGARRWEVDLLAVLPEYRGKGIASRLIAINMESGRQMGATFMRALIAVGNVGSEKAFAHCGFQVQDETCGLYVSGDDTADIPKPDGLYLLPVNTFNYRGVWLEGQLSNEGFRKAQAVRTRYRWDTAGAVIPLSQTKAVTAAQEAGYILVGEYRWWHY
jgi:GNAT superfamily N-acetyltransferase